MGSARVDCRWATNRGSATATITDQGLVIEIELHSVDRAFSGAMKLNYKRKIPAGVLDKLPATRLAFPVTPNFVYRAAGVRPRP